MTNNPKYLLVPYALAVSGVLLVLTSVLVSSWISFVPVHRPVDFEQGNSIAVTLVPDVSADYLIEIEVERNIPFHEINCMLGIGDAMSSNCQTITSPIDLAWEVRSTDTGELLAKGSSAEESGGAWGDTISRIVGRFSAEKGFSYDLLVTSNSVEFLPSSLNPHISVKIDPLVSKSYFVTSDVLRWLGLVIFIVGTITLVVSHRRNKQS